jgi:hypothetical protein
MPDLQGIDLNDLDSSFGGKSSGATTTPKIEGVNLQDLDKNFGYVETAPIGKDVKRVIINTGKKDDTFDYINPDLLKGAVQGLKDIPASGAQLIGAADRAISKVLPTGGTERADAYEARLKAENEALPKDNTAFDVGRTGGQILATAPLMTGVPFQAVSAATKSIPVVGKLSGLVANGAMSGGLFGASTNSANDEGLVSNVGTNTLYGAAAGPVIAAGAKVAGKVISSAQDIARAIKTNNILKNSGIDPNAAKNILSRLTDAGYTPDQAHIELQRMGHEATLSDLTPSLTTEAGGLASKGGMPTETLKSRFDARAAGANNAAHDIMETRLGPKPDYEVEKEAARIDRQTQTAPDYNRAKASKMALDVQPLADYIKSELKDAVGSEASYLKDIGSYLFDNKGNIKTDTAPLHKVRIALDGLLEKLPQEGTSQASGTYRAIERVRNKLDTILKINPDMAIADAKFAKLAEDFKGVDIGKKAIGPRGNYDEFAREFNSASPEKQEYMRKGLRIQIGDQMEKATRGELSEAQRLFGKSTANRDIIKLAFGSDGDEVLNALEKEAKFRSTERSISANSLTAERRAVQERSEYGGSAHEGHYLTPVASGAALDLVTGTPGGATAIGAGKGVVEGIRERVLRNKIKNTVEGSADLLSRQGRERDTALDFMRRINQVNSRNKFKLPIDNSGIITGIATPAVIPAIKRIKRGIHTLAGISEQPS